MTENGTATFASPDEYSAAIGAANLFVTAGGEFKGRLTWLNLNGLQVLWRQENLPRIAFVTLPPAQVHISFSATGSSGLIYCGLGLNLGDVVFHGLGERTHQRTIGEGNWCFISLAPDLLVACSKALTGQGIRPPSDARVIAAPSAARALLSPLSKACRLAETRSELMANPEVARSLQQEFGLVNCLATENPDRISRGRRRHTDVMVRFDEALATRSGPHLNLSDLCTAIDLPERTLRLCCAEFLGVSPIRYYLLRRLNMARSAFGPIRKQQVLRRLHEIISSLSSDASPWPIAPSSARRHRQHCAARQPTRNNLEQFCRIRIAHARQAEEGRRR